jgi:monofunctional biosynthetic peptidoglycan transglycosylase
MVQRQLEALVTDEPWVSYTWVAYDQQSPQLALAVIASEDQRFLSHYGFDFEAIQQALSEAREGGRSRGASTITQQVAKNVFLWNGRSWIRKGLEAYFTVLMEVFWPKRRILEVYLNIAEMGPNVFGSGAASKTYFNKPPDKLTRSQAALLAASLPNPRRYRVDAPGPYMRSRQAWIQRQMRLFGGIGYLQQL